MLSGSSQRCGIIIIMSSAASVAAAAASVSASAAAEKRKRNLSHAACGRGCPGAGERATSLLLLFSFLLSASSKSLHNSRLPGYASVRPFLAQLALPPPHPCHAPTGCGTSSSSSSSSCCMQLYMLPLLVRVPQPLGLNSLPSGSAFLFCLLPPLTSHLSLSCLLPSLPFLVSFCLFLFQTLLLLFVALSHICFDLQTSPPLLLLPIPLLSPPLPPSLCRALCST